MFNLAGINKYFLALGIGVISFVMIALFVSVIAPIGVSTRTQEALSWLTTQNYIAFAADDDGYSVDDSLSVTGTLTVSGVATVGGDPVVRSNTYRLCASNAQNTAQCDATVSGSADGELQAAHDAMPATGGSISLSEGTFSLAGQVLWETPNITLRGQGPGTVISPSAGLTGVAMLQVEATATDTTFRDFTIDGDSNSDPTNTMFLLNGAPRFTMDKVEIKNSPAYPYYAHNCDDVRITNSSFHDNGLGGAFASDGAKVNRLVFSYNRSYSNGDPGIENADKMGVQLEAADGDTGNQFVSPIISYNELYSNDGAGVWLDATTDAIVIGNQIYDNDGQGISLIPAAGGFPDHANGLIAFNVVQGNAATAALGYGAGIQAGDNAGTIGVTNWTLVGNIVRDNGSVDAQSRGIRLRSSDGSVNGFVIANNVLSEHLSAEIADDSGALDNLIRDNIGHVNEAHGSGTITNGTTSVNITHGLHYTPDWVLITLTSDLGSASEAYVSAKAAETFTVTVDVNPGDDVTFDWWALRRS